MPQTSHASKRLWVVTEVYYPEEISTGYYLTSIAEGLASDFDVKVLCGQPNYAARGTIAPKRELRNGVEIFRVASTTLDKNVIVYRVINMFTLGLSMLLKSLTQFKRGDHVLVVTAPPSLPFTTALAALVRGSAYTLLLHDCYPEQLIAVGKLKEKSALVGILNFFNRWLYKYASKIIVVGRDMKELMERKTAGLDIPVTTIPNWADLENIEPTPRNENKLLQELNLASKFVFMYAGNIGRPTDIETIIDAAGTLLNDNRFHFIFVGSGAKARLLVSEIERRKLTNITYIGQRPREEQVEFLNACDIALVTLVKGMWGSAMPSRTYNILAAGKPILALTEVGSELAMVIEEEEVGWHIEPGDAESLAAKILEIHELKDQLSEMGKRARSAAVDKYSLRSAVERYAEELG